MKTAKGGGDSPESRNEHISRREVLRFGAALGGVATGLLLEAACTPIGSTTESPPETEPPTDSAGAEEQTAPPTEEAIAGEPTEPPTIPPGGVAIYAAELSPDQAYSSEPPYEPLPQDQEPTAFDSVEWGEVNGRLTDSLRSKLQEQLEGEGAGALALQIAGMLEITRFDVYSSEVFQGQVPLYPDPPLGDILAELDRELQEMLVADYGVSEEEAALAVVGEICIMHTEKFPETGGSLFGLRVAQAQTTCPAYCAFKKYNSSGVYLKTCYRCCTLC